MKFSSIISKLIITLIAILLVAPTVLLIPMSFSAGTTFAFPPQGLSLRWYSNLVESSTWRGAAANSLKISCVVAPLATVLGSLAAFGLLRLRQRARGILLGGFTAPLIVPTLLTAMGLYSYLLTLGLSGTLRGIILGQTILSLPFVIIAVSTRLEGYDPRYTTAARGLGATPFAAFRQVTLPLVVPGILSGAILAFAFSFDELIVALLLQSPQVVTLPVEMYKAVTEEADPTISAASSVLAVFISIPILFAQVRAARKKTKVQAG